MSAVSRRVHAFEFMDQPWFPALLRGYVTDVLHAGRRVFRVYRMWSPLIARLTQETGERRLVDLCSGGGGPALAIADQLRELHGLEPDLTLTDLYPNRPALERVNNATTTGARYLEQSIDATSVPTELEWRRDFCRFRKRRLGSSVCRVRTLGFGCSLSKQGCGPPSFA